MNNTQNIYTTTYVFNNHSTIQYNIIYFHNFHPSIIIHNYYYTSPCNSIILFSYTVYTMDMAYGKIVFHPYVLLNYKKWMIWNEKKGKNQLHFILYSPLPFCIPMAVGWAVGGGWMGERISGFRQANMMFVCSDRVAGGGTDMMVGSCRGLASIP